MFVNVGKLRFIMGLWFFLFLVNSVPLRLAHELVETGITVKGDSVIAKNGDNFICATLDWWPETKCNYDQCPWGQASVLNLDLNNSLLAKAIKAFNPLRIRIGGSLQDQVLYDVGDLKSPCLPFERKSDGLFGFSSGCLSMDRWDELNEFLSRTGAIITFGLNALYGRHHSSTNVWYGPWDSSNARDLMKYTIAKGYQVDSWEFGNELSGPGVSARVSAKQYGQDLINLKALIDQLYENSSSRPLVIAPGGFFYPNWFTELLHTSGPGVLNVITHHIYNLGPGSDPNLVNKILNPAHLSQISQTFRDVWLTIKNSGPWATPWVGEAGGAYNSGGRDVSDTFVNSFWYLDQLGMSSIYHTKAYCRQSLIGGNYGLLDRPTFEPNPDYYSALLWHRLMGKGVLAAKFDGSPYLRTYAHCSKSTMGVTLLLINMSNSTRFNIMVENEVNDDIRLEVKTDKGDRSFVDRVKKSFSWIGKRASDEQLHRQEYHLTPKDGYLKSRTMLLNGNPLELTDYGDIPNLDRVLVDAELPISIAPLSIAFVNMPHFEAEACSDH
ncbi:heparanase-like protein 1 isoform X1 [Amborella trichopoda]|nr:heparanase-like protein 1 isoform X1 [Amborella trichopoda]|eukprot:XP_006837041.2 heparanase-like protein 1 isoform X1 [Amborella trichopoda]